jgi:hypothetical protein
MNIKSLIAGVALVGLAGPAFAVTTLNAPYGPSSLSYANGLISSEFLSGNGGILSISATNAANPGSGAKFELINDTTSAVLFDNSFQYVFGTYASGGSGVALVAGDEYTFKVTGSSAGADRGFAYSATISSGVPEMSTWVMMVGGFGALAFAGYRRRVLAA